MILMATHHIWEMDGGGGDLAALSPPPTGNI